MPRPRHLGKAQYLLCLVNCDLERSQRNISSSSSPISSPNNSNQAELGLFANLYCTTNVLFCKKFRKCPGFASNAIFATSCLNDACSDCCRSDVQQHGTKPAYDNIPSSDPPSQRETNSKSDYGPPHRGTAPPAPHDSAPTHANIQAPGSTRKQILEVGQVAINCFCFTIRVVKCFCCNCSNVEMWS